MHGRCRRHITATHHQPVQSCSLDPGDSQPVDIDDARAEDSPHLQLHASFMIQRPPFTRGEAVCFLPTHAFLGRAARPPLQCVQVYSVAHGCAVMQSKATCLIPRHWVSFTGLWRSLAELTALPGNTPCSLVSSAK